MLLQFHVSIVMLLQFHVSIMMLLQFHVSIMILLQFHVPLAGQFRIVFEARRGHGHDGDIALDDIKFFRGYCPPTRVCDFEEANACGYEDDTTDDFDWSRRKGNTTSANTGKYSITSLQMHVSLWYPRGWRAAGLMLERPWVWSVSHWPMIFML